MDIHDIVSCGCPSMDRKIVNSGKRLRAFVGIEEGDVGTFEAPFRISLLCDYVIFMS